MTAPAVRSPEADLPRERQGPRVGYLLKCFPRISETFVLNEVLELERAGVDLVVYSLNEPQEPLRHALAGRVRSPIVYLPYPLLRHAATYAAAHLALLLRSPLRYARALAVAATDRSGDLPERFVQAGLLARHLREDAVSHLHAGFVHFPGSVAWLVHLLTGTPFSLATHAKDMVHSPPALLRRKLGAARVVLTCTRFNVPELEAAAGPGGIRHLKQVYHGTDLERFPCVLEDGRPPQDPPTILSVGRLVEKKGLDHLVSACALLRDRGVPFRCRLVAGSRDLWEPLERQIRELGLGDRVVLEGPLDQADVARAYREATVFSLPCVVARNGDRDGIPNVLVEAAASGLPIVSTDVGGVPELVQHERTGLVVPPRDPTALADALARLLGSPELRRRLALGARRHVEERFDLRRNAVTVARTLVDAAGARRRKGSRHLAPVEQGSAP